MPYKYVGLSPLDFFCKGVPARLLPGELVKKKHEDFLLKVFPSLLIQCDDDGVPLVVKNSGVETFTSQQVSSTISRSSDESFANNVFGQNVSGQEILEREISERETLEQETPRQETSEHETSGQELSEPDVSGEEGLEDEVDSEETSYSIPVVDRRRRKRKL